MSYFISLSFITLTEFLNTVSPGVHVIDNDIISIKQVLHLLPTETFFSGNNQRLLDQTCFSLDSFSQSTVRIATRFGECSSTLLHKLWHLHSYIYIPTITTNWYGIYILWNSQHTSLFRSLSRFKHITPSASTPLFTTSSFTTCNTLQLLVLLESASAPSLSITSSTFFGNFIQSTIFLYMTGVDNHNNDPDSDLYSTVITTQNIIIKRYYIQYCTSTKYSYKVMKIITQCRFNSRHTGSFWLFSILRQKLLHIINKICILA